MNTNAIRKKILDLAIRGKLVPQDPNDEPASVLLERVRAEKERLVKEGKIKRDKKEPDVTCGDKPHYGKLPFELPEEGWAWARLGDVTNIVMGQSPSGNSVTNNPNGTEFHQGKIYFTERYLAHSGQYTTEANKIAEKGSVLLCVRAPVGIVNISDRKIAIGRGLCAVNPLAKMSVEFIFHWLTAFQYNFVEQATGTTFKAITTDVVQQQAVPIPPLAEQHRIVAAIESAFTVINEIEHNKADLQAAVAAAKSKILDLAIRGKLVPQDPNDEPADVLLERIRAEREALIKSGKIKRGKDESAIKECCDNSYYAVLPKLWSVCRLGDIIRLISGVSYDKNDVTTNGVRILRGGNIQEDKILLLEDDVFLPDTYYDYDKVVRTTDTVIVASTGSKVVIGKAGFITPLIDEKVQIGAFLRIIRPELEETARFVQLLFRSDYYRNYIRDISKGTNINNIKAEYIADFVIALPPLAEQHRITVAVESAIKQLDNIATTLL